MTNDDPFDYRRILGRIEEGIAQLREGARNRDEKLESLTERVRENAHMANNTAQKIVSQVERIELTSSRAETQLKTLDERVSKIEAPIKRAMQARKKRRMVLGQVAGIAATVASVVWLFAEPIWKVVSEDIMRRFMSGSK